MRNTVRGVLFAFLLFLSADRVLVTSIGPAIIRADDILGLALSLVFLPSALLRNRTPRPPAGVVLTAFAFLIATMLSYAFGHPTDPRVIGYTLRAFWFVWLFIIVVPWFLRSQHDTDALLGWSFILVGALAVAQFLLGVVLGRSLLVTQWFGSVPRVSGMSYEPSYFATYMLGAFAFSGVRLRQAGWRDASGIDKASFLLAGFGILSSTSRIGIAVAAMVAIVGRFWRIPRSAGGRILLWSGVIAVIGVSFPYIASVLPGKHGWFTSVVPRMKAAMTMIQLWEMSPIIGNGLAYTGGPWQQTGQNVFLEIAAGTGVVGFAIFLLFLRSVFRTNSVRDVSPARLALACQLLALMFNQNIFRFYLWIWISYLIARAHAHAYGEVQGRAREGAALVARRGRLLGGPVSQDVVEKALGGCASNAAGAGRSWACGG